MRGQRAWRGDVSAASFARSVARRTGSPAWLRTHPWACDRGWRALARSPWSDRDGARRRGRNGAASRSKARRCPACRCQSKAPKRRCSRSASGASRIGKPDGGSSARCRARRLRPATVRPASDYRRRETRSVTILARDGEVLVLRYERAPAFAGLLVRRRNRGRRRRCRARDRRAHRAREQRWPVVRAAEHVQRRRGMRTSRWHQAVADADAKRSPGRTLAAAGGVTLR